MFTHVNGARGKPIVATPIGKAVRSPLPSRVDQDAAGQLRRILAGRVEQGREQRLKLLLDDGADAEVVLLPSLAGLLLEVLRPISDGDAVTLVPVGKMLTTQEAADILNVSRPFLISLLERREIAYVLVGRHRRIKADDLFAYKERRDNERAVALDELIAADADLL